MDGILEKAAVKRFKEAADSLGVKGEINILAETARTAIDAANGLGIEVGQIASSLIFKLPSGNPLLIITSGRHRVDTELVAKNLNIAELGRADANYVKEVSGYSVGGVSPIGWISTPEMTLIDEALNDYEIVWAASGHPHAVYPTSYAELIACTGATPMVVGD
ncbi:YbaK/EbsC family protein [Candidatus Planktophila dulcis]|uniref:YbaK/EbsC family protein n=1 Tax=Candidatus Planktophila dulcis TaxID=1884914 RepID=UPI003CF23CA8